MPWPPRAFARCALLAVLSSCGEPEPLVSAGYPPEDRAGEGAPAPEHDELYDAQGMLRESDEVIAGLPMPRGLELHFREDRRHVFHARVPARDLLRYFGPRVITGEVTELGEGAVYRNGVPRGVKGGVVRLDVAIRPTNRGAQVEIFEIPPMPESPPSAGELSRKLESLKLQ
jgi:hypothetical protein